MTRSSQRRKAARRNRAILEWAAPVAFTVVAAAVIAVVAYVGYIDHMQWVANVTAH